MEPLNPEVIGAHFKMHDQHSNVRVHLIEYGATVTNIWCPDRQGNSADILLGCLSPVHHMKPHPHFNCIVGRYANRMTGGQFRLDGHLYELEKNIPPHHLHGGSLGFANQRWRGTQTGNEVIFRLHSPDRQAGYPGDLDVTATYRLESNVLRLEIKATTNNATPVNLSAHHYFNLSGKQGTDIYDHRITIHADHYLPITPELIQMGTIAPVEHSPFDLRQETLLERNFHLYHEQLRLAGGFDHNFVINGQGFREAARVRHPESGRRLIVRTNQPGVQLYTGNSLGAAGKDAVRYKPHQGLCLETQQFPDAPNHVNYPNAILRPGEIYRSESEYEFGVS